jgi:hypothetical protein
MLCDAENGFASKFEIYQGKKDPTLDYDGLEDLTSGPAAVIRLLKHLKNSWRIVYCDRFYTTMLLVLHLLTLGIFFCGTIRANALGFPAIVHMPKTENCKKGTYRKATTVVGGTTITAASWMDSKPVLVICSGLANGPASVSRWDREAHERKFLPVLEQIVSYQRNMGGVDRNDFLRMARYSIQMSQGLKKWQKMVFCALLDLAIVNSFILWKMKFSDRHKFSLSHYDFMESLANGLLTMHFSSTDMTPRTRSMNQQDPGNPQPALRGGHIAARFKENEGYNGPNKNNKRCYVCTAMKERHNTAMYCVQCDVPVCEKVHDGKFCWELLHNDPEMIERVEKRNRKRLLQDFQDTPNTRRKVSARV